MENEEYDKSFQVLTNKMGDLNKAKAKLTNVTNNIDQERISEIKERKAEINHELEPINENAPMLPYGYLTMLYLVLFLPFIYNKIMNKELVNWDDNFASDVELSLLKSSIK